MRSAIKEVTCLYASTRVTLLYLLYLIVAWQATKWPLLSERIRLWVQNSKKLIGLFNTIGSSNTTLLKKGLLKTMMHLFRWMIDVEDVERTFFLPSMQSCTFQLTGSLFLLVMQGKLEYIFVIYYSEVQLQIYRHTFAINSFFHFISQNIEFCGIYSNSATIMHPCSYKWYARSRRHQDSLPFKGMWNIATSTIRTSRSRLRRNEFFKDHFHLCIEYFILVWFSLYISIVYYVCVCSTVYYSPLYHNDYCFYCLTSDLESSLISHFL